MTSRSSPPNSDSDTDSDYSVVIDVPPKVLKKARKQAQPQKKKITPPKNPKTPKNPPTPKTPPKAEPAETEKKSSPLEKKRSLSPASPLIIKKAKPSLPDPSVPPVPPKKRITPVAVPSPRSDLNPSSGLLSNLLDAYFLEQSERGASHPWQQLMRKAWGHVRRSQKKKE